MVLMKEIRAKAEIGRHVRLLGHGGHFDIVPAREDSELPNEGARASE